MSQHNDHLEETIRISEKLIQQMERYRDQGEAYGQAADKLKLLAQRMEGLETQFVRLTPESLEDRLSAIETSLKKKSLILIILSSTILTVSGVILVLNILS